MTIKDWPAAERPHGKLLTRGLDALSDAELLAIVFAKGTAGRDAVQLARGVERNRRNWQSRRTPTPPIHCLPRARRCKICCFASRHQNWPARAMRV